MDTLANLEKKINSELTTKIKNSKIKHNNIYLTIDAEGLLDVINFLKSNNNTKFRQLIDITAVDYPENTERFKMIYLFLSHQFNQRIIISSLINENEVVPSLTKIFPSANWMEREVFDMYGVKFKDHPDLRRILTDYGFNGHPLRKDFPLTGHNEVRYSEEEKKVIDYKENLQSKLEVGLPEDISKSPIKVGLLLPLSGSGSKTGNAMLNAAMMAVFDIADSRLQLVPRDTKGLAENAAFAAETAPYDFHCR